jgi:chemotaxis protein MotB
MPADEPSLGAPEWVVTFGDMMSLLLTFFIMLVSMSEVKEDEKYHAMVDSMRHEFGHEATFLPVPGELIPRNSNMVHTASAGRARRRDMLEGGAKVKAVVGDDTRVQSPRLGQHASVVGVIQFEGEATTLSDESRQLIQRVVKQIKGKPQRVQIRGHASRRPLSIESAMRDKYDVAYERCREVMNVLVQQGIEPERIHYYVAADHQPVYEGIDTDQQQLNSRVQIMLWDERVGAGD